MHANRVLAIHKAKLASFNTKSKFGQSASKRLLDYYERQKRTFVKTVAHGGNLDENRNEVHPYCGIGRSCG